MIENTANRDTTIHLLGSMADGTEKYVTDMEADGQRQLVNSSQLPKHGPWHELDALGFVRGEDVDGDDLFVFATLPDGWSKVGTDHAMHSKIVDERGVERVTLFYKAAYYDRRADFSVIHVGRSQASNAVWGDGKPALPSIWHLMTDHERTEYVDALVRDLNEDIESHEWRTGVALENSQGRISRIRAVIALLPDSHRPILGN